MQFIESYQYQPETGSFVSFRVTNPDIALTISFEPDYDFVWDGDRNAPETQAYGVKITAHKIVGGLLFQGTAYLGGCYPLEDPELDFEVSGYTPQMIQEAIDDLDNVIAETFPMEG